MLVLDHPSTRIISSCCRMHEIMDKGVTRKTRGRSLGGTKGAGRKGRGQKGKWTEREREREREKERERKGKE